MNPRPQFVAALAVVALLAVGAAFAGEGEHKTLPPSDGGPASTLAGFASGAIASSGPKSAVERRKSGFASRAASKRDAFARNLFDRCRDTRGGPSQRACEYEYAAKVINR